MRRPHFLLIIMMLLAACGDRSVPVEPSEPSSAADASIPIAAPAEAEDAFTIVMLGDSLTAGFGLSTADAFPEQMLTMLENRGYELDLVNAGVSGDTTGGGLARYDWSVKSADPDLLIVALGANDFLGGGTAEAARENLADIIELAQADGIEVILAGIDTGNLAEDDPRIAEFATIYPDLSETYNVPHYPDILAGIRGLTQLLQLDGLHPTREGARVMAESLADFLEPHLPPVEATAN